MIVPCNDTFVILLLLLLHANVMFYLRYFFFLSPDLMILLIRGKEIRHTSPSPHNFSLDKMKYHQFLFFAARFGFVTPRSLNFLDVLDESSHLYMYYPQTTRKSVDEKQRCRHRFPRPWQ